MDTAFVRKRSSSLCQSNFAATKCQKLLRTPDGSSGKEAKCPQCGAIVKIPEPAVGRALGVDSAGSAAGQSLCLASAAFAGDGVPFGCSTLFNRRGSKWGTC